MVVFSITLHIISYLHRESTCIPVITVTHTSKPVNHYIALNQPTTAEWQHAYLNKYSPVLIYPTIYI